MNTDDPRTGCRGEDSNLCSRGEHDLTEGDPPLTAEESAAGKTVRDGWWSATPNERVTPGGSSAASGVPLGVRLFNVAEAALVLIPLMALAARAWWLA